MKKLAITTALLASLVSGAARAQDAIADFYRGKQIYIRIGSSAGSGYDLAGRIVAPFLSRYIPGNPGVVVQNVPGAGGLTLSNQLYNTAPKDGTVIGLVSNGMPTAPMLTPDQARFDISKFSWIGSNAPETQIVMLWHTAPAKTIDDLFRVETIIGATAPGVAIYDLPVVLNGLVNTRFKVVAGYEGTAQIDLATERGEVHGQAGLGWISAKTRNMGQINEGKLKLLVQFGQKKHPDLQHVPLFPLPADEVARQAILLMFARQEYGRPLLFPPGVPPARTAALRKAYQDVMKDPEFRREAERAGLEINPVSGEELDKLTQGVLQTSAPAVARLRAILTP